jgi:acetyl esterase/lipase
MSTPADAPDWRTLTRDQLDQGLNNGLAVGDPASIFADWELRSAQMRARHPQSLDLRYGPRERNRIDLLQAGQGGPTLVFIHGGYWQGRAKENFTFCVAGPLAHGIDVALIGYTLAPDVRLGQIVEEIHAGLDHLARELPALGGDPERIMVSGWSAGAHLSAMALGHPHVKAALLISGVYDLEPIRHSYLNAKLDLDDATIRANSPLLQAGGIDKPVAITAGSAELPLLRAQSAGFAAHRARYGLPVIYEESPGDNHFTILEHLASPAGRLTELVRDLAGRT